MRKMIATAVLCALSSPTFAADLVPLKAPRAPIFYGGSGTYCGAGVGGEATKIAGAGAATYEANGLINFNCGYTGALGTDRWVAVQANYAYSNAANVIDHKQSADLKVLYGAPLSVITGLFSNAQAAFPVLPAVPVGAINTTMHPFLSAGVRAERVSVMGSADQRTKFKGTLGLGFLYQTNTGTVVNTFVDWTMGSARFLLTPGAEIKEGSTWRTGVVVNYAMGG